MTMSDCASKADGIIGNRAAPEQCDLEARRFGQRRHHHGTSFVVGTLFAAVYNLIRPRAK